MAMLRLMQLMLEGCHNIFQTCKHQLILVLYMKRVVSSRKFVSYKTALCKDAISVYALYSSAQICKQPWLMMTGRFVTARLAVSQKYAVSSTVPSPVDVRLRDAFMISATFLTARFCPRLGGHRPACGEIA